MKFELGKCYEHTTGMKMRMLVEVDTHFYGHCILAETDGGQYIPCGLEDWNTENWKECEDFAHDRTEK